MNNEKKLFSIVVPIYGNEKNITITIPYFVEHLDLFPAYDVEIILVCDGSPDNSYEEMKKMYYRYPEHVRIVNLTRNFGQGAAIHCGMDMAKGQVIGVISCDMQDPFELFVDMLSAWEDGYKLVVAARKGRGEKGISAIGSKVLHKLTHKIIDNRYPVGGFDFFLLDREVSEKFREIDLANGAIQMALMWLGYEYKRIDYVRQERQQGKSGYKLWRKLTVAMGLFTTYSPFLSQLWGFIGGFFAASGFLAMILLIIINIYVHNMAMWILLSALFACTGLILCACFTLGEYIWRTFDNTKNRPRYVVEEKLGC